MTDTPNASAAAADLEAQAVQTPRGARAAAAAKPAAKAGKPGKVGKPGEELVEITLHDSKEIPPNGQFIGVNGRQFVLKPGVRTQVPVCILEVLDNAVHSLPELDDQTRVVEYRDAPRLTYTLHRD